MAQPPAIHDREIINLLSDDEKNGYSDNDIDHYDAPFVGESIDYEAHLEFPENLHKEEHAGVVGREVIDLTATSDVETPPSDSDPYVFRDAPPTDHGYDIDLVTEADCLRLVLDVFPDISVDHVRNIIKASTTDPTRNKQDSERIVNELLESGAYPKESKNASRKRRRADSEDRDLEHLNNSAGELGYDTNAIALLKDKFLDIPAWHIDSTFRRHKTLFRAYSALEEQLQTHHQTARTFSVSSRPGNKNDFERALIEEGSQLPKELLAAKRRSEIEAAKRQKVEEQARAEKLNLQQAQMSNEMDECQCCFTEHPRNRMISCSRDEMHLVCNQCSQQYIETEMGQLNCRPVCFASADCKGTFSRTQLQHILSQKTFERLEHMQQQEDIAAAGLDFLSECPFCDYKAELPPVKVDKEFRCLNLSCGKTSCRLCNRESHIPLSCKGAKKDDHITARHAVEEAMSAALIRKCNDCQQPFVKDYGCNKMQCPRCGNKQCYICKRNVNDYNHFGDPNKGRCPLHDNVEDVHERDVKRAGDEAREKVKAENPELSEADLTVKVSDAVKQIETERRGRVAQRQNEYPFEMLGDQLVHRPGMRGIMPPALRLFAEPPRMLFGVGAAVGAGPDGLAAVVRQPAAPAIDPGAVQDRGRDVFADRLNQIHLLAAQDRLQARWHRLEVAHEANRFQAELDRLDANGEAVRLNLLQQIGRLERQAQQIGYPALPAEPPVLDPWLPLGINRLAVNAPNGGAGAGADFGGLAFGGLEANRAMRNHDINHWIEAQQRNVPRQ